MKTRKNNALKLMFFTPLFFVTTVCVASPATGQLIIVNNLANGTNTGNDGFTQSNIKIEVYDHANSTQPCTTITNLSFNGVSIVRWGATGVHSATSCVGTGSGTAAIYQVKITPLAKTIGKASAVVYDATATSPQASAHSITFTAPTTVYQNIALIVNGNGTPNTSQTADATHWGFTVTPTVPIFDTGNGAVLITGIPGADEAYGIKAQKLLQKYGIPF